MARKVRRNAKGNLFVRRQTQVDLYTRRPFVNYERSSETFESKGKKRTERETREHRQDTSRVKGKRMRGRGMKRNGDTKEYRTGDTKPKSKAEHILKVV